MLGQLIEYKCLVKPGSRQRHVRKYKIDTLPFTIIAMPAFPSLINTYF